jgi:hypothetical protein
LYHNNMLACKISKSVMIQVAQLYSARWQAYQKMGDIQKANKDISYLIFEICNVEDEKYCKNLELLEESKTNIKTGDEEDYSLSEYEQ